MGQVKGSLMHTHTQIYTYYRLDLSLWGFTFSAPKRAAARAWMTGRASRCCWLAGWLAMGPFRPERKRENLSRLSDSWEAIHRPRHPEVETGGGGEGPSTSYSWRGPLMLWAREQQNALRRDRNYAGPTSQHHRRRAYIAREQRERVHDQRTGVCSRHQSNTLTHTQSYTQCQWSPLIFINARVLEPFFNITFHPIYLSLFPLYSGCCMWAK